MREIGPVTSAALICFDTSSMIVRMNRSSDLFHATVVRTCDILRLPGPNMHNCTQIEDAILKGSAKARESTSNLLLKSYLPARVVIFEYVRDILRHWETRAPT